MKNILTIGAILLILAFVLQGLDLMPESELQGYEKQVKCEHLYWSNQEAEMKNKKCDFEAIENEIRETIRGY